MKKSELLPASGPPLLPPSIPVICDSCRATGLAGDPAFAAIPDILAFDPVPRRAHVNNWTAEHQRAFIAALAITGSPRQAARAIGRHAFGAEGLKTARGGKGFAAAWEAAMELARERELARIHANLSELARTAEDSPPLDGEGLGVGCLDYDPDLYDEGRGQYVEAIARIRARLTRARRLLLFLIHNDEAKRAAWETLVGPVDWATAERLEAQADEPFNDTDPDFPEAGMPSMRDPDMLLTAEAGLLAEMTGGHDALAELREAMERGSTESSDADAKASPE